MRQTRTINKSLLRQMVKEVSQAQIAVVANCSPSLLQKLVCEGYEKVPSIGIIDGICKATGCEMDELFPLIAVEEDAAS